jgi:hypothetical protein
MHTLMIVFAVLTFSAWVTKFIRIERAEKYEKDLHEVYKKSMEWWKK